MERIQQANDLRRLRRQFGGYHLIAASAVNACFRSARDIACAITVANATNAVIQGERVAESIGWMLVAMFINMPIQAMDNYLSTTLGNFIRQKGMRALGDKLPRLPLAWIAAHESGGVVSTCTSDLDKYLRWMRNGLPTLIRQIAYYFAAIAYSLSQNVALTVMIFPVAILLMPLFNKITKPLFEITGRQRTSAAEALSKMQQVLADPEFIKSYSLEDTMERRIGEALGAQMRAEKKGSLFQALSQSVGALSSYLPGFIAAGAGVYFLLRGEVTAGFMVSFVQMCVQRFSGVLPQFAHVMSLKHAAAASAARLCALLDAEDERDDGERSLPGPEHSSAPVFEARDVCFGYGAQDVVLDGVSIRVEKGETVALVGSSGGGKSTLLSLLMGVYAPRGGEVLCMGRGVARWNPSFLRAQMAPVFQDAFLFPATVRENICGTACGDDARVREALDNAGLLDFVDGLPQRLDTPVGERGTSLSGGQRQRMTIARAFYKDAPILFFDEPTSALDTVTEEQFQGVYRRLKEGRTTLVVAHRLKTIRDADRIYVLENGKVVQEGRHDELIAQPGAYRRLYETQAQTEGVRI